VFTRKQHEFIFASKNLPPRNRSMVKLLLHESSSPRLRAQLDPLFTVVHTDGAGEKQEPALFDQLLLDR